jgi:hypothetical protein
MSDSTLALLLFIGVIVFLVGGIIYAMTQRNTTHSGSFASMAAFHDMQPKDKQGAIEIIIEKQAQKRWEAEESGEGNKQNEKKEGDTK